MKLKGKTLLIYLRIEVNIEFVELFKEKDEVFQVPSVPPIRPRAKRERQERPEGELKES